MARVLICLFESNYMCRHHATLRDPSSYPGPYPDAIELDRILSLSAIGSTVCLIATTEVSTFNDLGRVQESTAVTLVSVANTLWSMCWSAEVCSHLLLFS